MSPQQAAAELKRCAGSQFDPEVIAALATVLDLPAGEVIPLRPAASR
jgi:HD-GYP domain-containing protein (c-di-GMP phosphodiesterase class II)